MAELIPWDEFEDEYASNFGDTGNVAYPLRMALGTLIIKEKKNTSNKETIQEIVESRYLQYFIGLHDFTHKTPFDQSAVTRFAQRLGSDIIQRVNQRVCEIAENRNNNNDDHDNTPNDTDSNDENKGKIILDSTCAPSDIRYPTDVSLMNQSREKLENIIDTLHEPMCGKQVKPRTYRKAARKDYLSWAKKRKKSGWKKALRKQLGYVGRDLRIIDEILQREELCTLSPRQIKDLDTIRILYTNLLCFFAIHTSSKCKLFACFLIFLLHLLYHKSSLKSVFMRGMGLCNSPYIEALSSYLTGCSGNVKYEHEFGKHLSDFTKIEDIDFEKLEIFCINIVDEKPIYVENFKLDIDGALIVELLIQYDVEGNIYLIDGYLKEQEIDSEGFKNFKFSYLTGMIYTITQDENNI